MWLSRIDGLNIKKQQLLLEYFESARDVFFAKRTLLGSLTYLNEQNVSSIVAMQNEQIIVKYANELEKTGIRFVPFGCEEYPELLTYINEPPMGLYIIGKPLPTENKFLSVIGSRKCSEYGLNVTHRLSKEVAKFGVVVVSGMARGIDSMANKGALDSGGYTIAVLGGGADVCYPPENKELMERIKQSGCIISEYPPGAKPLPRNFPARNRIISGLSQATLVVEAGKQSGTSITAGQALDEGREVLAVPGDITSVFSYGTNELIKNGAAMVTCCEDILDALGISYSEYTHDNKVSESLSPEEKIVYNVLSFEPKSFDSIINETRSSANSINYVITILEIKGLIKKLPGRRYIKN